MAAAQENDAWIVFNGHADKVAFGGRTVHNPATFAGMRDRTLVVGCMSKNYLMPGWRIGWAAGPRAVMGAMEDVHIFNGIMPSGITQAGATAALAGPQGWQAEAVGRTPAGRAALLEAALASPRLSGDRGRGRLLLPARHPATGVPGRDFAARLLAEHDVAVTPMQGWGADDFGEHLVRLIFTNEPEDRLREAGRRIAAFADSCNPGAQRLWLTTSTLLPSGSRTNAP